MGANESLAARYGWGGGYAGAAAGKKAKKAEPKPKPKKDKPRSPGAPNFNNWKPSSKEPSAATNAAAEARKAAIAEAARQRALEEEYTRQKGRNSKAKPGEQVPQLGGTYSTPSVVPEQSRSAVTSLYGGYRAPAQRAEVRGFGQGKPQGPTLMDVLHGVNAGLPKKPEGAQNTSKEALNAALHGGSSGQNTQSGPYGWIDTPGNNMGTQAEREQVMKTKAEQPMGPALTALTEGALAAKYGGRSSKKGKGRTLTWAQYNRLSPAEKASVDFNTLLNEALTKDKRLSKRFGGKDRVWLLNELGKDATKEMEGYRSVAHKVFGDQGGKAIVGQDMRYMPNTVAALKEVGVRDIDLTLDEILGGSAFITDADLKNRRQKGYGNSARGQLVNTLAKGMRTWEDKMSQGRVEVEGLRHKVDFTNADLTQIGAFIDAAATGMSGMTEDNQMELMNLIGKDQRFGSNVENGFRGTDYSALANSRQMAETQKMLGDMQKLDNGALEGFTPKLWDDKEWQTDFAKFNGYDVDRWLSLIQYRRDTQKGIGAGAQARSNAVANAVNGG